jgi:hypothetical protein
MSSPPQCRVDSRNLSRSSFLSSGRPGVPLKSTTWRRSRRPSRRLTMTSAASGVGRSLATVMVMRSVSARICGSRSAVSSKARGSRVAEMRQRDAERDAVLRHHPSAAPGYC